MKPEPGAADPRQRLLAAAEALFAAKGYDGASVRDICDAAGMNGAAVNYHFGDKESLYVAAVRHAHAATAGFDAGRLPVGPAVDRLKALIAGMAAEMVVPARPCAVQLLMRELGQASAVTRSVVEEFIRPVADQLRGILRELMPGRPDRDVLMAAYSVVGQCLFYRQNRTVMEILHGPAALAELTVEAVTAHITAFTLAGLGLAADPPPTAPPRRKK